MTIIRGVLLILILILVGIILWGYGKKLSPKVIVGALAIGAILLMGTCTKAAWNAVFGDDEPAGTTNTAAPVVMVQDSVERVRCTTVCVIPSMNYEARIWPDAPIYTDFPNVSDYGVTSVYYSGEGTQDWPRRGTGRIVIRSADPNRKANVRIFEMYLRPKRAEEQ